MYLIYSRRSTDDTDNQKNSLEYQEVECRRYAERQNLPIAPETTEGLMEEGVIKERHSAFKSSALSFSDGGMVEYSIERPKFMKMINLLLEKKYSGVIVLCWDRISRNEQSDLIVKEMIKKHGICVKFVQAEYDVSTSSGELHMDIDGMFARHHSRVTSEKVKHTFKKLRGEGKCTYVADIGYLDHGPENKELDPERAPIIKRCFELYDSGEFSINSLTRWAQEQGLTSKPRRRKRTKSEILRGVQIEEKTSLPISSSTMHQILRSQFYIGKIKHKGEWAEGLHAPLIDEELFWRVQDRLGERCVSVKYADKMFFTYRGLFRCSCGRTYTPYLKKGHIYYCCKCKAGCDNAERNIKEDVLVDAIQALLDTIHFTDEELQQIEAGAKKGLQHIASKRDKETEDLHRQRKRIHKDLDYLRSSKVSLLREKAMSPTEWREEADKLTSELKEVDALLEAQTETEEEMLSYVLSFSELMKSASSLYKDATSQEKRRLAHLVFSELTLVHGKVASYKAKPEFEILLNRPCIQVGSSDWTRTSNPSVTRYPTVSNRGGLYHHPQKGVRRFPPGEPGSTPKGDSL